MRYNKKGVSGIVTVLIIVALSIVAIGIVWRVILPMLTTGTQNIDFGAKCLEINLKPTSLICANIGLLTDESYECTIKLKRETGTGDSEFNGVIAVFSDDAGIEESIPIETGNIGVLSTYTIEPTDAYGITFEPTTVQIAVYLLKEDGTKYICPGTSKYTNT